jgi:hypothetical protein
MSNITNTCLYQACADITNIPSQDMCLNHVPNHVSNHQPVPYQASIVYHNKCINHAPTFVPNRASTMDHNLYEIVPRPCTITYTISLNHQPFTSITIPSTNHVHQHMYHTMYQQCISTITICHITQTCHTPCTIRYVKQVPSMMYLNKVPSSPRDVSHTCVVIYQV